jgi:glucan phosphoethanolaminetransferase (alkaline phosphatase superfamily)
MISERKRGVRDGEVNRSYYIVSASRRCSTIQPSRKIILRGSFTSALKRRLTLSPFCSLHMYFTSFSLSFSISILLLFFIYSSLFIFLSPYIYKEYINKSMHRVLSCSRMRTLVSTALDFF